MQRDTHALANGEFDVAIIGGGAFGAAAAWDASLRGLKTALIERNDFSAGSSAECFKMVHGGIRYLQHADIPRLRSSCHERSAMLRIAPHLVAPLPIVIPTYGHGRKGKLFLGTGMRLYDFLTLDRNAGIADRTRHIPGTRFLSRSEVLALFPDIDDPELTGGAVFDDGQMYSPPRLVLAFVKSAVGKGAVACNYVEALDFLWEGDRVRGVRARDRLDGSEIEIRAKLVLNAAGPGAEYLLERNPRFGQWQRGAFSRDACFIVRRKPRSKYALAIQGRSRDRDSLVGREARHMFVVPWRDFTLIGVWHKLFPDHPDKTVVEEEELSTLDPRDQRLLPGARAHARGCRLQELRSRTFRRWQRRDLRAQLRERVALHRSQQGPRRLGARHVDRHPLHDGAWRCGRRSRYAASADAECAGRTRDRKNAARRRGNRGFRGPARGRAARPGSKHCRYDARWLASEPWHRLRRHPRLGKG